MDSFERHSKSPAARWRGGGHYRGFSLDMKRGWESSRGVGFYGVPSTVIQYLPATCGDGLEWHAYLRMISEARRMDENS